RGHQAVGDDVTKERLPRRYVETQRAIRALRLDHDIIPADAEVPRTPALARFEPRGQEATAFGRELALQRSVDRLVEFRAFVRRKEPEAAQVDRQKRNVRTRDDARPGEDRAVAAERDEKVAFMDARRVGGIG